MSGSQAPTEGAEDQPPVVVFAHAHYRDVWREIADLLAERMTLPFRLVVTTGLDEDRIELPRSPWLRGAAILRTENRGRDILPFLAALRSTDGYDIGLKLHTKRSLHRLDGDAWRHAILASLLPPPPAVEGIAAILRNDPRIGLVGPARSLFSVTDWLERNHDPMRRVGGLLDLDVSRGAIAGSYFCAGSMFWFRRTAMQPFQAPQLLSAFEAERGQVDGTTAHALERLFAIGVRQRGYVVAPVEALEGFTASVPASELDRLTRSMVDQPNSHLQPPRPWLRRLNRYVPLARTAYRFLPDAARRRLRSFLTRKDRKT